MLQIGLFVSRFLHFTSFSLIGTRLDIYESEYHEYLCKWTDTFWFCKKTYALAQCFLTWGKLPFWGNLWIRKGWSEKNFRKFINLDRFFDIFCWKIFWWTFWSDFLSDFLTYFLKDFWQIFCQIFWQIFLKDFLTDFLNRFFDRYFWKIFWKIFDRFFDRFLWQIFWHNFLKVFLDFLDKFFDSFEGN